MNEVLQNALQTGNIAGAYLLECATEEAFWAQADGFLRRLFCADGSGCGICPGCQKYIARNHVDMKIVQPEGAAIKVDAVREVASFLFNKSYEGGYKAVLVPRADRMTDQAQNALLKVLEEPPGGTVFLLGAPGGKNLLPTILSRCIIVRAQKCDADAEKRLAAETGLPTLKARVLLNATGGDYFLAKEYAENGYFEIREDVIRAIARLLAAKTMATSAIEKLILAHEQNIKLAMEIAVAYLADVLDCKYTGGRHVKNEDKLQEIAKHAQAGGRALVNISEAFSAYAMKCEQCPGMNKKLELAGMLFTVLEGVI